MTDEEKKAFESVKDMFEDVTIKDIDEQSITIYGVAMLDVIKVLTIIEKQQKEIEHQKLKRENQRLQLAILNAKQVEFNKLVNTVNSYKGQFKKQQKEIDELEELLAEYNRRGQTLNNLMNNEDTFMHKQICKYYISKDKIKEILGIEENIDNEKLLSLLQTIVDENARLEDIEDRKVQIEYNNVFNKGVKSVEDKIKALIEELEKLNEEATGNGFGFAIHYLKSLLKKE